MHSYMFAKKEKNSIFKLNKAPRKNYLGHAKKKSKYPATKYFFSVMGQEKFRKGRAKQWIKLQHSLLSYGIGFSSIGSMRQDSRPIVFSMMNLHQ
jgi:hypothetical protein